MSSKTYTVKRHIIMQVRYHLLSFQIPALRHLATWHILKKKKKPTKNPTKTSKVFYTPPVQEMYTFCLQREINTKLTTRLLTMEIFNTHLQNRRNLYPEQSHTLHSQLTPKQRFNTVHKNMKTAGAERL